MAVGYESLEPSYVPVAFKRYGSAKGASSGEFWDTEEQLVVRYRPGNGSDRSRTLTVCWAADQDRELMGTRGRRGVPVDVYGVEAVYHDGQWQPGPGPEQVDLATGPLHWDRREHSITMRTERGVFAVRGPQQDIPEPGELVQVLSSVEPV